MKSRPCVKQLPTKSSGSAGNGYVKCTRTPLELKERRLQYQQRHAENEFNAIWDSLEPCLKDKLISIDSILHRISYEAIVCGVKADVINKRIPERFWDLARRITGGDENGLEDS